MQNPTPAQRTINQTHPLKTTQSLNLIKSRSTLYSTDDILNDEQDERKAKLKSKRQGLFFFFLFLIGLGGGGYFLEQNFNLSKWAFPAKAVKSQKELTLPLNPTTPARKISGQPKQISLRKVFINSKPSGAAIYINNRFSEKYTPALISLTGDKLSSITIKKQGYHVKQVAFNPKEQSLNSVSLTLTKNNEDVSAKPIRIIQ